MLLKDWECQWRWPRPGEDFDWKTMKVKDGSGKELTGIVKVALFPALLRISQEATAEEETVFEAVVILREGRT